MFLMKVPIMPRPPIPVGTWGRISRDQVSPGVWRAMARFRDFDGVTRKVEARAETGAKAERLLVVKLKDRAAPASGMITSSMRVHALAPLWWEEFKELGRAVNTESRYRYTLDHDILPALGNLRLSECSVSAVDRFLKDLRKSRGAATAKLARTVSSGMFALAVRHDAMPANPVRDSAPIRSKSPAVRALTLEEVHVLRQRLRDWQLACVSGRSARPQDILDVIDLMLGTGCRIGEALALRWSDVDLSGDKVTATISGTVITDPDKGLTRQSHPKSSGSFQTFTLPKFAGDMLLRRNVEMLEPNAFDAVFPSATGTLRSPNNYRKQWRKARADIGFSWVTPHTFRKSVGTLLSHEHGLSAASAQLGHSSEKMTADHYVQRAVEAQDFSENLEAFGR